MKKINLNNKFIKTMIWLIFVVYLLALVKVILFKYPLEMTINTIKANNWTSIMRRIQYSSNYVPFQNISQLLFSKENTRYISRNILGNIIAFIPLGILLPILKEKARRVKNTLIIALSISLIFELIQLLSGIGDFDIDDLILNTVGGFIGLLIHKILYKFFIENHN